MAHELGSILAGGPAPFVAAVLLGWGGGQPWLVAVYIIVLSSITTIALYFGPETYRADIAAEERPVGGVDPKRIGADSSLI